MLSVRIFLAITLTLLSASHGFAEPSRTEVLEGLRKATLFLSENIAAQGGYAWVSSVDGKFRNGEGACGPATIWVQPPGTPAIGMAFLDAYEATQDPVHLKAAEATASALVKGQLRSGGWYYHIEFDPKKRAEFLYRDGPNGMLDKAPKTPAPGGWDIWKQRRNKGDMTIVDDDVTPAVMRFLMRIDRTLEFKNKPIHEAVQYALASTRNAQYPIGAWSHNYDHYPTEPPDEKHYPIKKASYPEKWSRTWTKDWTGCYMLNDRITQNMIATMLLAHRVYNDKKYQESAERGGKFLILAQMPDPQPAWCQEYNRDMQPVWDRKFEPPAITGLESQDVLETLLQLYRETGNKEFLEPIPKAVAHLRKSALKDGSLARFYELQTNKPLYFNKAYLLTYNQDDVPTHYRFADPSRLDAIDAEYGRLLKLPVAELRNEVPVKLSTELLESTQAILKAQNPKGAWTESGTVRDWAGRKLTPAEGVIQSKTFIDNVAVLCKYLKASAK